MATKAVPRKRASLIAVSLSVLGVVLFLAVIVFLLLRRPQRETGTQTEGSRAVVGTGRAAADASNLLAVAKAQELALIRLGADTAVERDSYLGRVQAIARRRHVPETDVYYRSLDALACRGAGWTTAEAMDALDRSYLIVPARVGADAGIYAGLFGRDLVPDPNWWTGSQ